jgi:hypothetical protein
LKSFSARSYGRSRRHAVSPRFARISTRTSGRRHLPRSRATRASVDLVDQTGKVLGDSVSL